MNFENFDFLITLLNFQNFDPKIFYSGTNFAFWQNLDDLGKKIWFCPFPKFRDFGPGLDQRTPILVTKIFKFWISAPKLVWFSSISTNLRSFRKYVRIIHFRWLGKEKSQNAFWTLRVFRLQSAFWMQILGYLLRSLDFVKFGEIIVRPPAWFRSSNCSEFPARVLRIFSRKFWWWEPILVILVILISTSKFWKIL